MIRQYRLLFSRSMTIAYDFWHSPSFWLPLPESLAEKIVDHPDKLKYEELKYQPPKPDGYRHTLKCGATAYVVENSIVPTFDLTIYGSHRLHVRTAGQGRIGDMTGYLMRNGGVQGMTAKEIDERLAFLAGEISVNIGDSRGRASLFCLSKDVDEGLGLLKKILRTPVFDQEALTRYRADVLSEMEQRNSSAAAIESREWQFLMYGDHPAQFRSAAPNSRSIRLPGKT